MGLKREVTLLAGKKRLEYLYHMTVICLIGIHFLEGLPKGGHPLDACKILGNALLDDVKHQRDNG